ncbi:hypothetical protein [Streptomyces sp. NPDC059761]|uniref:hypothetical protein n=1 Tax=Streptomyces sp. NPDC059761 TaxID=3346937 RepID=UPI0036628FB5
MDKQTLDELAAQFGLPEEHILGMAEDITALYREHGGRWKEHLDQLLTAGFVKGTPWIRALAAKKMQDDFEAVSLSRQVGGDPALALATVRKVSPETAQWVVAAMEEMEEAERTSGPF